jgi:hypothetical protein
VEWVIVFYFLHWEKFPEKLFYLFDMPFALFFVTVLISLSLVLSTMGLVKRANTSEASLAADAAVLASLSVVDQAWSDVAPDVSVDSVKQFQDYNASTDFELFLNQGVPVEISKTLLNSTQEESLLELFERSAEIFLFDVFPDEMLSGIALDICHVSDPCPELILEWFRFDRNFRFQDLSQLNAASFDSNLSDQCVDLPAFGVQRCVVRSSGSFLPAALERLDADSEYLQRWRLRTSMASYDYLVRAWVQSDDPVWIRLTGLESFPDGVQVPLPQQLYTAHSQASAVFSTVLLKETRRISAGLQDGLGFVHYADEVEDK